MGVVEREERDNKTTTEGRVLDFAFAKAASSDCIDEDILRVSGPHFAWKNPRVRSSSLQPRRAFKKKTSCCGISVGNANSV